MLLLNEIRFFCPKSLFLMRQILYLYGHIHKQNICILGLNNSCHMHHRNHFISQIHCIGYGGNVAAIFLDECENVISVNSERYCDTLTDFSWPKLDEMKFDHVGLFFFLG